jgi:hypothetical protein
VVESSLMFRLDLPGKPIASECQACRCTLSTMFKSTIKLVRYALATLTATGLGITLN